MRPGQRQERLLHRRGARARRADLPVHRRPHRTPCARPGIAVGRHVVRARTPPMVLAATGTHRSWSRCALTAWSRPSSACRARPDAAATCTASRRRGGSANHAGAGGGRGATPSPASRRARRGRGFGRVIGDRPARAVPRQLSRARRRRRRRRSPRRGDPHPRSRGRSRARRGLSRSWARAELRPAQGGGSFSVRR